MKIGTNALSPRAWTLILMVSVATAARAADDETTARDAREVDDAVEAADDEVAATRQRFEAMQQLTEAHARATEEATRELQAKMKAARTPEARRAIQEAYQAEQHEREETLRRKLTELSGR